MGDRGDRGRIDAVRAFCRAQKPYWQQLPALAIEAAEPGEEMLELVAGTGLWPVGLDDNLYSAYVDCATGEIVDGEDPSQPAPDDVVARLGRANSYLDARRVIAELSERVAHRGNDKNAAWRADVKAAIGESAKAPYVRTDNSFGLD